MDAGFDLWEYLPIHLLLGKNHDSARNTFSLDSIAIPAQELSLLHDPSLHDMIWIILHFRPILLYTVHTSWR